MSPAMIGLTLPGYRIIWFKSKSEMGVYLEAVDMTSFDCLNTPDRW